MKRERMNNNTKHKGERREKNPSKQTNITLPEKKKNTRFEILYISLYIMYIKHFPLILH